MSNLTKSFIALGMVAGMFLASGTTGNTLLANPPILYTSGNSDGDAAYTAHPVDPYPQWGNANGAWVVWWGYGQRDNWNYFKAYSNRDRAQTVAQALRGQGYVARVSPR